MKLHKTQYIDKYGKVSIKDWEATMDEDEVKWCWKKLLEESNKKDDFGEYIFLCSDSFRAARANKSSQRRRFIKLRSCCGCREWFERRWNAKKFRFDIYLLGFNYGH